MKQFFLALFLLIFSFAYSQDYIKGATIHFAADTGLTQADKDSIKTVLRILRRYSGPVIEMDMYINQYDANGWTPRIGDARIRNAKKYILDQGIDPARIVVKVLYTTEAELAKFKIVPIYYIPTIIPVLFSIVGTVTDAKTHNPIANATVHMIGTDLTNIPHNTDASGVYMFYPYDFNPSVSYQMKCVAPGYTIATAKDSVITEGLNASKKFVRDIELRR